MLKYEHILDVPECEVRVVGSSHVKLVEVSGEVGVEAWIEGF